jgi:tetratricopeptide (TPR) repeat protein
LANPRELFQNFTKAILNIDTSMLKPLHIKLRASLKRWLGSLLLSGGLLLSPYVLAQPSGKPLVEQAQAAQTQGDYAKAESLWQQVLKQQPNLAMAHYNLGLSQHRQANIEGAISSYKNVIRLDPKSSVAHLSLGFAYLEVRRYDLAIPAFQQVLALPNQASTPVDTHTLAHYDLAIIYKRQGNLVAARQAVQKALALTPNFAPAQMLLQQLQ